MAMGSIDLATIARSQDYSNIRHNETTRVISEQSNLVVREQKEIQQKVKQVRDGENAQWHNRKFDAKEKGDNRYGGDGGRKRKQTSGQKAVPEKQGGFDIKI